MATTGTEHGSSVTGGIGQTLRDTTYRSIDGQKARASETLGSLAGAVRKMSDPLREGGQQQIAEYATKAADGIERWASQLRQQDLEDAVRAVQQFARRQPAMFLGIAFGAGLVAARFLKSSSDADNGRSYQRNFEPMSGAGTSGYGSTGPSAMNRGASGASAYPTGGATGSSRGDIPRVNSDLPSAGEVL